MFAKLTVTPLLWACGLLLAAVAWLGITLWGIGARHDGEIATVQAKLDTAISERDAARAEVRSAVLTNTSQQGIIEDLAARLNDAITANEQLDRLLTDANNTLIVAQRERAAALSQLEAQRETDYATDPSCAAWGAAPVCARITGGLRDQWRAAQRSARGDRDPAGGSAAAAAGAGTGAADGRARPARVSGAGRTGG